ncbi:MAG: LLM class flavin-dependent oxidoreductase [Balneolaceae bacterium]
MLKTELFTTTPQSVNFNEPTFADEVRKIAVQSEKNGYKGTLIYSDNRLADPWELTGFILAETTTLLPMIALQPAYMHPYTVAKKIATYGLLYGRQISLNLIAGGFKRDLEALGDHTEHDKRYQRLIEYTEIIQLLLQSKKAVSYEGEFYSINRLKLQPELPPELQPLYYLSGSSDAAKEAAQTLDAKLIEYPEPHSFYTNNSAPKATHSNGIRIGILTRTSHDEAWEDARLRFPETREGALTHQLAKKTSDSSWHKKLSDQGDEITEEEPVYWLGPFKNYNTFCPYLVGSYDEVTEEITHYLQAGCNTCILDIPVSESELKHTKHVFTQAEALIPQC